jgi:putative membrane protein
MRVNKIAATMIARTATFRPSEVPSDAKTAMHAPTSAQAASQAGGTASGERVPSDAMGARFLVSWAFNVVALFVASWILSGVTYGDQWWTLLIAGVVFTIVNAFVKPILTILSLPFIIVTLGLFYFLLNILMLYLTDWIVSDFEIETFWWGALAAIIVSVVNWILHQAFGEPEKREAPAY